MRSMLNTNNQITKCRKLKTSVEGHLWKAQWKVKPNDEGHKKLTMNKLKKDHWAQAAEIMSHQPNNAYLGLKKVNGLKEARKERNSIPWTEYELEK